MLTGILLVEMLAFGLVMFIIGALYGQTKEADRSLKNIQMFNDKINEMIRKYSHNPNPADFNEQE